MYDAEDVEGFLLHPINPNVGHAGNYQLPRSRNVTHPS